MKVLKPKIIHKEDDFVIVEKPSGVLSIQDRFDENKFNIKNWLRKHLNQEVFTVHRIDLETSGLLIFALNKESHRYFNQLFQQNEIEKFYKALVHGNTEAERLIDLKIQPSKAKKGLMETNIKGKSAITIFKRIEVYKNISYLNVQIKTGRTHQIRVHLSEIGFPILMDEKYGNGKVVSVKDFKSKFSGEPKPMMNRLALHAHQLSFMHPVTKEKVSFESPVPKDFQVCLKLLNKYAK